MKNQFRSNPMFFPKLKIISVLMVCLLVTSFAAIGATPADVIESLRKDAVASKDSGSATVAAGHIGALFDFPTLYSRSLGDYWDTWNDDQKNQFSSRFEELFIRSVQKNISKLIQKNRRLVYSPIQDMGDISVVSLKGSASDGSALDMKIFFSRKAQEWRICDIEVSGALLSRNYRGMFNRILRQDGFSALISKMNSKLDQSKETI